MQGSTYTARAGAELHNNPMGVLKTVFFIGVIILLLLLFYKMFRGLSHATELVGEFGPSTEAEKLETISNPVYQENINWLNGRVGIETLVRKGGYKTMSAYLAAKNLPFSKLSQVATQIWDAKLPFYISGTEVYNAISSLPSKVAVSLMADEFNRLYADKWNGYPLNGFLSKYLKLPEMQTLTAIINKKPEL